MMSFLSRAALQARKVIEQTSYQTLFSKEGQKYVKGGGE